MKITNNEIVVELPETFNVIDPMYYIDFKQAEAFKMGKKTAISETKNLNPPRVVDVEALAQTIFERSIYWEIHGSWENLPYGYKETLRESAQHLASNLGKWLIEKKEDRTDDQ